MKCCDFYTDKCYEVAIQIVVESRVYFSRLKDEKMTDLSFPQAGNSSVSKLKHGGLPCLVDARYWIGHQLDHPRVHREWGALKTTHWSATTGSVRHSRA